MSLELTVVEQQIIEDWKRTHHLTKYDKELLIEAYRRYNTFHKDEPLTTKTWVGLGTPSSYKSKYFNCYSYPTPKVAHWWVLTEDGVKIVKDLIEHLKWRYDFSGILYHGVGVSI